MPVNKAILVGNVGADPEIRSFNNGGRCATLSLATSEAWTDKASGERREKTEWHRVVVFNEHLVGVVERFVKKGSQLYIEGQIETRKWQDQSGQDRYSTEIALRFAGVLQMIGGRPQGSDEDAQGGAAAGAAGRKPAETGPKAGGGAPASRQQPQPTVADAPVVLDDEIAF